MRINDLKKRLRKDRPTTTISLKLPDDVINDLQRIAPLRGCSDYRALIRAYIGQSLRADLERFESRPELSNLIESLRRHGVDDAVIANAMAEVKS
jgi:hypothetical protein